jgi:two-component system, NtrC family, response regulator HydG
VPIEMPPLRAHREDVPELIDFFLGEYFLGGDAGALRSKIFAESAWDLLKNYHWPGNVRELQNIAKRARILFAGTPWQADQVRPWLLAPQPNAAATVGNTAVGSVTVGISLREMEKRLIRATLDHFDGHRRKTADALGIGLRTLTTKLKEMK